ncbi:hypothetical protein Rwratislav_10393 [Rhodococcus wratislaviensis IFP 2016]|nr:hypothetical protein Rwratislav_10393 [Rhodococcus wratislaviensis IFP 2016]
MADRVFVTGWPTGRGGGVPSRPVGWSVEGDLIGDPGAGDDFLDLGQGMPVLGEEREVSGAALRTLLTRKTPPKSAAKFVAATPAADPRLLTEHRAGEVVGELLGNSGIAMFEALVTMVDKASHNRVQVITLANIARTDTHIAALRTEIARLREEIVEPATPMPLRERLGQRAAHLDKLVEQH